MSERGGMAAGLRVEEREKRGEMVVASYEEST